MNFTRAAFYFVAHADDWQLFMMPEISRDIGDKNCKVSIVHLTAGDAGRDETFWKAREQGALDSLSFRAGEAPNCQCIFLRLPDGNSNGSGFERYGNESLQNLYNGGSIHAVDGSATYSSWQELADKIDSLIGQEENVLLNFPEFDAHLSPFDHNDHHLTGRLIQSTKAYRKYSKRAFVHYNTLHINNNLTGEELFWKIGMFTAYHQSVYKSCGHSTIAEDSSYLTWCFRSSAYRSID